jgi:hypothetical protein
MPEMVMTSLVIEVVHTNDPAEPTTGFAANLDMYIKLE